MRPIRSFPWTLVALLGFVAGALAADKPQLELSDGMYPLQEIHPLDRKDYILALDGKWNAPPINGVPYYVNFFFPDGGSYAHRVVSDYLFGRGDVRCVIQDYQFLRHGLGEGGSFTVVVSMRREAASLADPNIVSNRVEERWPMNRPVVTEPVQTKHSPAPPTEVVPIPVPAAPPAVREPVPPPPDR